MERGLVYLCLVFSLQLCIVFCYKPVIFMHGLFGDESKGEHLAETIKKAHPGTNVTIIDAFNGETSLRAIKHQVKKIIPMMEKVMKSSPDGVNMICYSQGGVICRAVVQTMRNHNVHNFIAVSSPLAGQYGVTEYLEPYLPNLAEEELYRVFYTRLGQLLSIGNYWNDPHHQKEFRDPGVRVYLAVLNNQTTNPKSWEYKKNFLRLTNMISLGGPDDGVIAPWQSSHYAMYNSSEKVVDVRQQEWYLKDSFGLKTLDMRGGFHVYSIPGIQHLQWITTQSVFDCCIEPWLT